MDRTRKRRVGEDFWALGQGGGGTGFVGAEHGFAVGDAGGEMDGYEDADEIWSEGIGPERRHGSGREGAGANIVPHNAVYYRS